MFQLSAKLVEISIGLDTKGKEEKMKKYIIISLLLFLVSGSLFSLELPQVDVNNLRSKGMGGVMLTIIDDQYSLINNPAGPSASGIKFVSLLQAKALVSGDFLNFWDHKDAIVDIASGDADIDNDTWSYLANLKLAAGTTPLYFALINILPFNLNLATFTTLKIGLDTNLDVPLPTWDLNAVQDTVVVLNFGMPIFSTKDTLMVHVGASLKAIHRYVFTRDNIDLFALADLSNLDEDSVDVKRALGIGLDLGAIAQFGKKFTVALTITDVYGTRFNWNKVTIKDLLATGSDFGSTTMIEPSVHVGGKLTIGTIFPLLIEDLIVAVDVHDVVDGDIAFFLKVYAGAEFSMLKGLLDIRVGLYQGWISAGLAIHIPILPIDVEFAYWGEELGDYPGQERIDNFGVSLNIVF